MLPPYGDCAAPSASVEITSRSELLHEPPRHSSLENNQESAQKAFEALSRPLCRLWRETPHVCEGGLDRVLTLNDDDDGELFLLRRKRDVSRFLTSLAVHKNSGILVFHAPGDAHTSHSLPLYK